MLISLKVNKNTRDQEGRTPLHLAVMSGNEKVIRKLIITGASLEIKDKKDRTPLILAQESSARPIVKMLEPPTLMQKLGFKQKTTKAIRKNRNMVALLIFLCFAFVFVITFCSKSI